MLIGGFLVQYHHSPPRRHWLLLAQGELSNDQPQLSPVTHSSYCIPYVTQNPIRKKLYVEVDFTP
jgi:hypothetical protein